MTASLQDMLASMPSSALYTVASSTAESSVNWERRVGSAVLNGMFVTLGLRQRSLGTAATVFMNGWQFYRAMSRQGREAGASAEPVEVERSITVGRPADELYEFWREPEHLTQIMGRFADVSAESEERQHWKVGIPNEQSVSWETRIVEDAPGEELRWESVEDAALPNEGTVRFRSAPGDRGTEVTLQYRFDPPGGALGKKIAQRLHIVTGALVSKVLHRFKSLAETGEIPTLKTNPSARGKGDLV
jgi:uncharacterized membrane protein